MLGRWNVRRRVAVGCRNACGWERVSEWRRTSSFQAGEERRRRGRVEYVWGTHTARKAQMQREEKGEELAERRAPYGENEKVRAPMPRGAMVTVDRAHTYALMHTDTHAQTLTT